MSSIALVNIFLLFYICHFSQIFFTELSIIMNIYVSNLGYSVHDEDLNKLFGEYGNVSSAKVITDKFTSKSRGFGFVEMADNQAAETAIRELNGKMIDGRPVKVSEARPREERQTRGDGYSKRW